MKTPFVVFLLTLLARQFAAPACAQPGAAAALDRTARAVEPATAGIGRKVDDLGFKSLLGSGLSLRKLIEGRAGLVVVMTSTGCPISRRYAPRAAALERMFEDKVAFLYVNAVDAETAEQMRESIKANGLRGPYAADAGGDLRRAFQPSTTTEVFLLDKSLMLFYRGALDDQYRIGGAAAEPKRHYLREAIEALLAGRTPETRATRAPGCLVDLPVAAAPAAGLERIEYYPRVAKIVDKNCVACHRPAGPAPFSLEFPDAVKGRAAMIEAVVREGLMPPGHHLRGGDGAAGALTSDRSMSAEDKNLLTAWLRSARLIGDASTASARAPTPNTWDIGPPDLILTTPGITLAVDGPMQFVRQLMPVNLDEDRWIESIECRPVMPESMDSALVWMIPPGGVVPPAGVMPPAPILLTSFSPGDGVRRLGPGTGRRLPAGALLVVDAYARPMGRATTSQLRVAMRFQRSAPDRELQSFVLNAPAFEIAAGDAGARVEASTTMDEDAHIAALQPFMRGRGRELVVESSAPNGSSVRELLSLGRYDWRWQIRYTLRTPISVTKGTRITIRGVFDNSAANPGNPDATQPARAGPGPLDEALLLSVETVAP